METLDKKKLLEWIKTKKDALVNVHNQHTGYHKRHLAGQHSSLVDIEWEIDRGTFNVESENMG